MIGRLIVGFRVVMRWLSIVGRWLYRVFATPRFAKIISNFLAEVGVLVSVFPGLEIIIRNEPNRLYTVIPWSWGITVVCLVGAAIISHIGEVP